ncbi:hypothetical protein M9H77_07523 [Catharanthus roseus]|uniref:Uncharacterized protein n=1 Tax=Catharanthus roseus TaxID=4058 RepID=A0ACC0BVK0_CATRO|nr:hypothetical protein M9H77_07523 [Catharanthus roseus]
MSWRDSLLPPVKFVYLLINDNVEDLRIELGICLEKATTIEFVEAYNKVKPKERRKRLASIVLPNRPTGRKSAIKRIEPDLNPREFENEAVSNSLDGEMVATPPLRHESSMNEEYSGQIHNTVLEIGEEKSTTQIPGRKKGMITKHMCNGTFVVSKYWSRYSTHAMNEVVKKLNDEQQEVVVRMVFRSMLELRTCSLPYNIFSWMRISTAVKWDVLDSMEKMFE